MSQFAALGNPAYRQYWLGSVASVGGMQLLTLGQGWLVFELTHSPVTLGLLGAAASIPNILVSLFGGAIADRLDKRVVLRTTALVNAALILVLTGLDFSGQVQVWHVLAIAGVQSLVTGLDWPTRSALYPMLINREHMMSAVALNSIIWQGTRMVMPAIGGALLAYSDTWVLFMVAAIGTLCMAIVVHRLDGRVVARGALVMVNQDATSSRVTKSRGGDTSDAAVIVRVKEGDVTAITFAQSFGVVSIVLAPLENACCE